MSFCITNLALVSFLARPGRKLDKEEQEPELEINFRTGTFLRENSSDLRPTDLFKSFKIGPRPTLSLRLPRPPRKRSLKHSNSSPVIEVPRDSGREVLVRDEILPEPSYVLPYGGDQANGIVPLEPEEEPGDVDGTRMRVGRKPSLNFFGVVAEASAQVGLPLSGSGSTQGFMRRGLREKLTQRAEEAKTSVAERDGKTLPDAVWPTITRSVSGRPKCEWEAEFIEAEFLEARKT